MNGDRHISSGVGLIAMAVVAGAVLMGCGDNTDELTATAISDGTVPLGGIPDPLSTAPVVVSSPSVPTAVSTSTTTVPLPRIEAPIGQAVDGDRLIFIGDSLLASMSPNNNARLCDVASSFGWQVEIDSQTDAGTDFATTVIDAQFPGTDEQSGDATSGDESSDESGDESGSGEAIADWDVVALVFGSEVDGGDDDAVTEFEDALDAAVARLAPRPTLLYTLTEVGRSRAAINAAIEDVAERHPNTVLIDFAELGGPADEVLEGEGRRFNEDGRKRFSVQTAAVLAEAPGGPDGRCLGAEFDDE
jgi:hypothetical protein